MIADLFTSCLLKLCILLSIKSIYLKQNSMLFFKNEGDVEFLYFFLVSKFFNYMYFILGV